MSTTQSPEQRELSLVGKVEMRIALADSDSKLETILKTYLAPLLLKLGSDYDSVRKKVISVCQHVNTRVKPESIQLPVAALLQQFKDAQNSTIRYFDVLYILQGVNRLSSAEKANLFPILVKGIASSGTHGPRIFNLFFRLLDSFALPLRGSKEDRDLRNRLEASDDDVQYLGSWMGKLMLSTTVNDANVASPGLSKEDSAFLNFQEKELASTQAASVLPLSRRKFLAAKLLASGLFNDKERFLPALYASADPTSTIGDVGDDMMKRALPATDLEDQKLINQLFALYFGSEGVPRVRASLRLKVLGLLNKSTRSTNSTRSVLRLVEEDLMSRSADGQDAIMTNGNSGETVSREVIKLRSAIFMYMNFFAKHASKEALDEVVPLLIDHFRNFIMDRGWPKMDQWEDLASRGYAYELIGLLIKAGRYDVFDAKIRDDSAAWDPIAWLFDSLARESSGNAITVSVEESLASVLGAVVARRSLDDREQKSLERTLVNEISASSDLSKHERLRSTRYVALRFANRCLPYSSVEARYVNILGLGATEDRAEVKEEAERGLSPYWHAMLNGETSGPNTKAIGFPPFTAIVQRFFSCQLDSETDLMEVARRASHSPLGCFGEMAAFTRRILFEESFRNANFVVNIDSEWERRLDAAVESDAKARAAVKSYLRNSAEKVRRGIEILMGAVFIAATGTTSIAGEHFVEFLALAPDVSVARLVPHMQDCISALQSNNYSQRTTAARAFGILASHMAVDVEKTHGNLRTLFDGMVMWKSAVGAESNKVHGAILALGFYFSRSTYRGRDFLDHDQYLQFVKIILNIIQNSRDNALKEGSYITLGQLCMYGALGAEAIQHYTTFRVLVDTIYDVAKGGNETAILCLGQISMALPEADDEESDLKYIQDRLHKLHEIRQAEVHFSVGEAFSYVASGWQSGALATKLDIDGPLPQEPIRSSTLGKLVEQILRDCENTKPALKKAAVMWLLCLVQFCGDQRDIQDRLAKCQAAFKRALSDRDELVQETGSRGLGLVYEKGDRRLKDDLVRDLVSSFSSDRQSQLSGNVSADTQLFEPGALPTGDGSVSTYKDIMSLASEVGDSSLVYKFMSMASSNAIWSSRAAFGRFGLSNVLSDSSVDGYLANNPKLYAKLFRYRFDPNSGVQRSMNDIWNALVKDSASTIDKYFDAIMEDLLKSILGKEWRVREACCAAIADLVSGRPLEKYEQYLERIWTQCFKVLDDIKETVRAAAGSLARTLASVLARALEADRSSTKATAMLKHVLPFLFSPSSMESSAAEVQAFGVHTLLEIVKKSSAPTLRPFIPEIVERMIGLLSILEPEAVNYVHLNASKYNLTEQKIDDMRLSSVRSSPLMEAIERCLDLLDEDTMRQLQPRLESAMKGAVGLPSKVGSSRILVSLSTRRMALYRPFADDGLKLIEKLVLDRNETVSSSYAMAAGYVARSASDKQILHLISFTKRLYFDPEGDRESAVPRRSIASGEMLHALAKHASDRFNALAASILPFVFVAKHDPHEHVKEQFQNTWNEAVGGSRAVLLYLGEILELCISHLDSPQWSLKHTSARTVADAVAAVASQETSLSSRIGELIWPALEKALSGKTWEGKEVVLEAFAKFVEIGQTFYTHRNDVDGSITKIAIREARRSNPGYRRHAVRTLGRILLARSDVNLIDVVLEICRPLLADGADGDPMDVDGAASGKADEVIEATHVAATETLLGSVNPSILRGEDLRCVLVEAIRAMASLPGPARTANVRRALYTSLVKLFHRIEQQNVGGTLDFDSADLESLLFGVEESIEALRGLRQEAVAAVRKACPVLASRMKNPTA